MSLFPSLTIALFAAPLLYNNWVVRLAKLVVQTVAIVLNCTPAVKPSRASSLAILGMTVESNPVHATSLLSKSKQVGLAVRGVVPIVPSAPVNTKCRDKGAGAVAGLI